ncbi:hypothetical protein M3Y94_00722800 [Aphelenchoides besseyi]|nr:hypothetical protein M3Y94_00722800 [Aphelenchoides besseyi]KAI6231813.1 hypothetical protein M3Y95_00420900 [Aphelenchoides besseyi]
MSIASTPGSIEQPPSYNEYATPNSVYSRATTVTNNSTVQPSAYPIAMLVAVNTPTDQTQPAPVIEARSIGSGLYPQLPPINQTVPPISSYTQMPTVNLSRSNRISVVPATTYTQQPTYVHTNCSSCCSCCRGSKTFTTITTSTVRPITQTVNRIVQDLLTPTPVVHCNCRKCRKCERKMHRIARRMH